MRLTWKLTVALRAPATIGLIVNLVLRMGREEAVFRTDMKQDLVREHDGTIDVNTTAGTGSTFIIRLAACSAAVSSTAATASPKTTTELQP